MTRSKRFEQKHETSSNEAEKPPRKSSQPCTGGRIRMGGPKTLVQLLGRLGIFTSGDKIAPFLKGFEQKHETSSNEAEKPPRNSSQPCTGGRIRMGGSKIDSTGKKKKKNPNYQNTPGRLGQFDWEPLSTPGRLGGGILPEKVQKPPPPQLPENAKTAPGTSKNCKK